MAHFDVAQIQHALQESGIDGWLLYDFRGSNSLARTVLDLPSRQTGSRRWAYGIPQTGTPVKIVHQIEKTALNPLPGDREIYLHWKEWESSLKRFCSGRNIIAMEYSSGGGNPYISRVDAGTVELVRSFGVNVVSSGDLIQLFESTWTERQWEQHQRAAVFTNKAYDVAWKLIADRARAGTGVQEKEVETAIMDFFHENGLTTYHPPIVARNEHSGSPHYGTGSGSDTLIRTGDFVLIDLWAKLDEPGSVYSDLTRVGYVGESVPQKYTEIFQIVAAARDRGIEFVREEMAAGRTVLGGEVDDAVRDVIEKAGYGSAFTHRTGHNIGQEVHGNGAHIDNLETRETRSLLPRTCFSIEPGIYLEEFGIRSEVDVYVDENKNVHVTGGMIQTEVIPLLRDY
ncbi:MAG TPA: M24 family metallopeptidase [Planctomicrobium sp.]|nr:M24 family metallopeptidase [Planctomicrobium sp.]